MVLKNPNFASKSYWLYAFFSSLLPLSPISLSDETGRERLYWIKSPVREREGERKRESRGERKHRSSYI